jgi:hypothetical protein
VLRASVAASSHNPHHDTQPYQRQSLVVFEHRITRSRAMWRVHSRLLSDSNPSETQYALGHEYEERLPVSSSPRQRRWHFWIAVGIGAQGDPAIRAIPLCTTCGKLSLLQAYAREMEPLFFALVIVNQLHQNTARIDSHDCHKESSTLH